MPWLRKLCGIGRAWVPVARERANKTVATVSLAILFFFFVRFYPGGNMGERAKNGPGMKGDMKLFYEARTAYTSFLLLEGLGVRVKA